MSDQIHLRDYLRIINKRRHLALVSFVVLFLLVLVVGFSLTPHYEGATKILIEKSRPSGIFEDLGGYDPTFYETQYQLIKSQAVGKRVVEMLDLTSAQTLERYGLGKRGAGLKSLARRLKEKITDFFGGNSVKADSPDALKEELAIDISEGIEVKPIRNSRVVMVSFFSANPEFAALVANSVAKAYIEVSMEMKLDFARISLDWMTKKAAEEGAILEQAEKQLQQYMVKNNILGVEEQTTFNPEQLSQLNSDLMTAENKRERLQNIYEKVVAAKDDPRAAESIPTIVADPSYSALRASRIKAEQRILELSSKYGPKHPLMIKARDDLNILKEKGALEVQRIVASLRNELDLARANERNISEQLNRSKFDALSTNQKFIQYGVLKREVETTRQLYDSLMLKIKEQSIASETQAVNLWIVERAVVPDSPVKPSKKKVFLGGLFACLFLSLGLVFFIEYLDTSIKYPDETEKRLGVPVLGTVSLLREPEMTVERALLDSPRSAFSENFKALRTSVMLSTAQGMPERILVTSAAAGAGKTTTSLNLAYALAQAGKNVLLIDGDMRKPRLHKILKLDNDKGLSTYLAGGSQEEITLASFMSNLTVIPSGPIPPNPSELLATPRFEGLLEDVQNFYDVIVCDSPPLLSVTDALILARLFQGTIMVVRARQTTFDFAAKALKQLTDVNAPVLGMVINALDLKKGDYYYQYYYGTYGDEPEVKAEAEAGTG